MPDSFVDWETELLRVGNIVQDGDESVADDERHARFMRYIEMLDAIRGDEGIERARAVIRSIRATNDYGAYQTTQHTLGRFPPGVRIQAFIDELPALIERQPDWAGELLCGLANSQGTEWESDITLFNSILDSTPSAHAFTILRYIAEQEEAGWLKHRQGVLWKPTRGRG